MPTKGCDTDQALSRFALVARNWQLDGRMVMITVDQDARLRELWDWVLAYLPAGKTRRQFWVAFDAQARDLPQQVWADNAEEALRERWVDLLSLASDRGFDDPESLQDQPMA